MKHLAALLRPAVVGALALLLLLAGCGGADDAEFTSDDGATSTDGAEPDGVDGDSTDGDTGDSTDGDTGEPGDADEPGGGDEPGDTDEPGGGDELPGEAWDGFAESGDELAVVGVAYNDVLNVRSIPGTGGDIVATIEPDGTVEATGQARLLPTSAWYEVTTTGSSGESVTGWAAVAFLAYPGVVDDATAEFADGGPLPSASSLIALGTVVAEGFASEDPPSDVVQVAPAFEGSASSLAEVTYDVIGLGDDAAAGYRLHIFANNDGDSFSLKSIERTVLCTRGLVGELCA